MRLFLVCMITAIAVFSLPSQTIDDIKREIIVYFQPDVLEFPVSEREAVRPENLNIRSANVEQAFRRFRVERVARVFPDFAEADTLIYTEEGRTINVSGFSRTFTIRLSDAADVESAIESFSKLPGVIYAERNWDETAELINDPDYPKQWHLKNTGQTGGPPGVDINAEGAWQISTGNSSIRIGIFDTGVELSHDEFVGKISGDNVDATGTEPWWSHGTHVAGVAAARANNSKGGRGVDWNAQIDSRKIFNGHGTFLGYTLAANKVTSAAVQDVHVMNHSYRVGNNTTLRRAFAFAYKMNRISVAGSGNTGTSTVPFPARFANTVIAVGPTDYLDARTHYGNYGQGLFVVAPGGTGNQERAIWSSQRNNSYRYMIGASQATPQVAGIASLLKGHRPGLYNDDIKNIIKFSADKVRQDIYNYNSDGWNDEVGYGRVNAGKALEMLITQYYTLMYGHSVGGTSQGASSIYNMTVYGAENVGLQDGVYSVRRHEVRKNITYSNTPNARVWCRGVETIGWANEETVNFSYGWCEPVPGTVTSTGATLRTYVYEVYTTGNQFIGWYPSTTNNVKYEYTVLRVLPPSAPSITLDASGVNPKLNWNAVNNTDSYNIYYGAIQGAPGTVNCSMVNYSFRASTTSTTFTDNSVWIDPNSNILACYYVTAVNLGGQSSPSNKVGVHGMAPLRFDELIAAETISLPKEYEIFDNYPNPFNPVTTIRYNIPEPSTVSLVIYDIMGREVRRLVDGIVEPGYHAADWDSRSASGVNVSSGIYIYRFTAQPLSGESTNESIHYVKKMLLTK